MLYQTTGVPVIPFFDLGNSGGTLRGVDDGASPAVNLPSPLPFGVQTPTTAFVNSYFQCIKHCVIVS